MLLSFIVPHGVKMLYDGEEVDLKPHEEEAWVLSLFYLFFSPFMYINI